MQQDGISVRQPPPSVAVTWQNWTGAGGFAAALIVDKYLQWSAETALILMVILIAAPLCWFEGRRALAQKKLRPMDHRHWQRIAFKLAALVQTWIVIAGIYWIVPFYFNGSGMLLLKLFTRLPVLLPLFVLIPLYLTVQDRAATDPEDVLFRLGRRVAGFDAPLSRGEITQYAMGWAIKGFFLPLMVDAAIHNIHWWSSAPLPSGYFSGFDWLFSLMYFLDVAIAVAGYLCTLKLFDTHIRSSQPAAIGWLAALICYPPFWDGVSNSIFPYNPDGRQWGAFFGSVPVLSHIWAAILLSLIFVYVAATVQFGLRFSNLTNRGIITNGPYRWLKHPAYLCKNLSWWMLAVPFLSHRGFVESVRSCMLLLALNGIYYLRAKTEEAHLSEDAAYREYFSFMQDHGIAGVLRRFASGLQLRPRRVRRTPA